MKIIRNIDGKKLELTLTNEEAMNVFMDVFFDTDKFADYPANGLFGRGDGIFAERCKQHLKKQSGGITARRTPSHMAVIRCKRMTAMTSCSRWCWKTFCSITRKSSGASRRMRNKPAFMTSLKNSKLRN